MALYRSLHDRLKNQHQAIEEIISGCSKPRLVFHPAPGKWSIHDNIAHLARFQPIFMERINTILKEDTPSFERYKAENDMDFETWRKHSTHDLLKILSTDRQQLITIIENLVDLQLCRTGIHKKYGTLTITQWIEFFLLHEAHHIFTVFQLANNVEIKL